jgi:hypothetical protein
VHDTETWNAVFTSLTIVANVAFVSLVLVWIAALVPGGRGISGWVVSVVGPRARPLALLVAATAMLGSLYYSEIAGFLPCELCWFQRICMYPLAIVLAVGVVRRDRAAFWYAAPFVAIGASVALYHWLIERVPSLADSSSCSAFVPCTVPYFQELGYVTLAFMSMSAFLLVGALLVLGRAHDRTTPAATTQEV